jgi:GTP-binding protein
MKKLVFKSARFLTSALKGDECPSLSGKDGTPLPEIAIVGRSNVGKSSLLNHLMQDKTLAKVSSTPGKTQRINYFLIDERLLLVDLPGYGYAKVKKAIKKDWAIHLENYLNTRPSLKLLLFLLDIRRTPNEDDIAFFQWALFRNLPTVLILTKADKLKKREQETQTKHILDLLSREKSLSGFPFVLYSVKDGGCKRQLIEVINQSLNPG